MIDEDHLVRLFTRVTRGSPYALTPYMHPGQRPARAGRPSWYSTYRIVAAMGGSRQSGDSRCHTKVNLLVRKQPVELSPHDFGTRPTLPDARGVRLKPVEATRD